MERKKNELSVITKAKELCQYVMVITQKSPKHFRYTFVSRLQNLSLDIIESLIRANDVYIKKGDSASFEKRAEYQRNALTSLKLLSYMAMISMEQQCILPKQYEQISILSSDCINLVNAWMKSDKRRFSL